MPCLSCTSIHATYGKDILIEPDQTVFQDQSTQCVRITAEGTTVALLYASGGGEVKDTRCHVARRATKAQIIDEAVDNRSYVTEREYGEFDLKCLIVYDFDMREAERQRRLEKPVREAMDSLTIEQLWVEVVEYGDVADELMLVDHTEQGWQRAIAHHESLMEEIAEDLEDQMTARADYERGLED